MSNSHQNYLSDLGYEMKVEALDARRDRDAAPIGTEERAFKNGRLLAFYEIISTMRNRAEAFGIPLSDLRLDDVDPDRDLT